MGQSSANLMSNHTKRSGLFQVCVPVCFYLQLLVSKHHDAPSGRQKLPLAWLGRRCYVSKGHPPIIQVLCTSKILALKRVPPYGRVLCFRDMIVRARTAPRGPASDGALSTVEGTKYGEPLRVG